MKFWVIWHYMANYNAMIVEAETAEEAYKNHWYGGRKELEFFVCPVENTKVFNPFKETKYQQKKVVK